MALDPIIWTFGTTPASEEKCIFNGLDTRNHITSLWGTDVAPNRRPKWLTEFPSTNYSSYKITYWARSNLFAKCEKATNRGIYSMFNWCLWNPYQKIHNSFSIDCRFQTTTFIKLYLILCNFFFSTMIFDWSNFWHNFSYANKYANGIKPTHFLKAINGKIFSELFFHQNKKKTTFKNVWF